MSGGGSIGALCLAQLSKYHMHVGIDIRALTGEYPTGVASYTLSLTRALANLAPEVKFSLFASGSSAALARVPRIDLPNIQHHNLHTPNRLLSLRLMAPFGPRLEDFLPEPPDVWIFPKFDFISTRLPYLLTIHDLAFELFPQFITRKEHLYQRLLNIRGLAEGAAKILAVSANTANDLQLRWGLPANKITVTPLGVDQTLFAPREQPSDRSFRAMYDLNRPYFLTLATQEPRKNQEAILEAYGLYRQSGGAPYPLVMAGTDGWKMRQFHRLLSNHAYRDDIWVIGYVPEKHKPALMRGATAFLFPSFYEGFGLPSLEALACGVPVITGVQGSLPDVLGNNALFVDPFNVNDLAQAMLVVATEQKTPAFAERRTRGLEQAQRFTWEKTAAVTLQAVAQVTRR